nr:DUF222 domain-containing protein [Actinomycetales bacterium]
EGSGASSSGSAASPGDSALSPSARGGDPAVPGLPAVRVPRVAGGLPRVTVTMRESDLRELAEQAGLLPGGVEIPAGELRRILCDAGIVPVVLGSKSEVLDVGMEQRLVTPAMRRALTLRDGGCVFPGCDVPPERCEAHHVVPWWMNGPTALHNLVLLCPHHHGVVEPPRFFTAPAGSRWQIRMGESGKPELIPPRALERSGPGAATPRPTKVAGPKPRRDLDPPADPDPARDPDPPGISDPPPVLELIDTPLWDDDPSTGTPRNGDPPPDASRDGDAPPGAARDGEPPPEPWPFPRTFEDPGPPPPWAGIA